MKRFLKFLKWAGITLGTLLVLFIAINAFDETLDPGAAAILNAQPKVKAEENAYFYLVGLYAPPESEPVEFGRACVARLIDISKSHEKTMALYASGNTGCTDQEIWQAGPDISAIACHRQQASCFSHYLKQGAAIKQLAGKYKALLQRYERMLAMTQFDEGHYASSLTIALTLDSSARELYSAISVSKLREGNPAEFVRRTVAAARYDRMVMRGESSFSSKMIASYYVNNAANMVSNALREYPTLAEEFPAALLNISLPFTAEERSLVSTKQTDLRISAAIFAQTAAGEQPFSLEDAFFTLMYQPNATLNHQYRALSGWEALAQMPTERYLSEGRVALKRLTSPDYLRMIYNPMGKYLSYLSSDTYSKFVSRFIDADGLLRLGSLQIQIAAQRIPEADIPALLKQADPQFRDPYTGLPMQWDKARGLYFRGYSDRITDKVGFVTLKL